jgi:hypothetical protein
MMSISTEDWVAQAQAALLGADPPAVAFVPATWQEQHYAEYSRRLLAVYAACAGWPRERVAPLWPFVEGSSRAFELGAAEPWGMALAELERRVGVAS